MRLLIPALLIACLVACGARQHAHSGESRRVRVRIEGNHGVGSDTLLEGLSLSRALARGQQFDPYLVSIDEDRVRGYYLRKGIFRVEVASRIDETPGAVEVVFTVVEGPRARLARVEIAGLPPGVRYEDIRALIHLGEGAPFDYQPYDAAKPFLVTPLERAGYAHAKLDAKVAADKGRDEAIIRLEFEPGPLCTFGEVTMRGVSGPLERAARARIVARTGERYSMAALEETQAALYAMGRFAVVRVEPERTGASPVVPVTIEVTPADRHELRLGGGVGLDPESADVHGRAAYRIAGWPWTLTTSRAELRPAVVLLNGDRSIQPRIEASTAIERLDLFRTLMRGEAEASLAYLAVEAYTTVGPRFRLGLTTPLGTPRINASVGWQIRLLDFRAIDPAVDDATATRLGLDVDLYRLGFFEQSISVDLRNRPVETTSGLYGELRAEEGTVAAGGAFTYLRLTPELRAYVSPFGRIVLAARGRLGTILGDLPVTQRYFSGGASNQRGFPERRLAPTATQVVDGKEHTAVVGGGGLAEVSLEVRAPIGTLFGLDFGGVVFLDGGDVTERLDAIDVTHLHWASGVGLRVATPIGPVRLDVGYRLNRTGPTEPEPGRHFAFHLSLGEAF
jgi:outer membrane translocation and assembly module TamA